jgi:hypothetical protein
VFEEMAHAGDVVGFVPRAGADEKPERRAAGLVVALGDDFEPVV